MLLRIDGCGPELRSVDVFSIGEEDDTWELCIDILPHIDDNSIARSLQPRIGRPVVC
jgi:hypothetical protein